MGSRWPSWLNECQYQLEAPHSGVLAKRPPRRGVRSLPCIITRITSSHTADTPQPRTSRGQRSYKDKRCRQRSRKYETRGVAEERLARIWPGPTAVIARHHHGTGQLPKACCSSSVVSGRKWNIAGIIIKTSFLWNLRGIQTQMEYMNRVLCLKKKKKPAPKWTSADITNRRFTAIASQRRAVFLDHSKVWWLFQWNDHE